MSESLVGEANFAIRPTTTDQPSPWPIRQITADQTAELRQLVLWPDKPLDSIYVRLADDNSGYHFGAFVPSQDKAIAVISVFFSDSDIPSSAIGARDAGSEATASGDHETSAQFRKFACHPEFQGQGIGTSLLRYVASYCASKGTTILWCDARASTPWYEKRGLAPIGYSFTRGAVEFSRMKMVLADSETEGLLETQPGTLL